MRELGLRDVKGWDNDSKEAAKAKDVPGQTRYLALARQDAKAVEMGTSFLRGEC